MKEIKIFASCHNHSCFSDAEYTPEELVAIAKEQGHGGFILTDHDTVRGTYFTNKAARKLGMKSILGCEFTTTHNGRGVHFLGFDFNPDNKAMAELLAYGSSVQTARSELLFKWGQDRGTLRKGITWQDVLDDHPYNDYICCDQVFTTMVRRGIYKVEEYEEFRMPNFSYKLGLEDAVYAETKRSYKEVITSDVVEIIKGAGGVPVVAHPHGQMNLTKDFLDMGVMGFETRFPSVTEEEHEYFENICDEHGFYKMGGSDHSGILGGIGNDGPCAYEVSGISEENFMKIFERKLG
jgi:predicted metal-dependent phosphoesterase TrpH